MRCSSVTPAVVILSVCIASIMDLMLLAYARANNAGQSLATTSVAGTDYWSVKVLYDTGTNEWSLQPVTMALPGSAIHR